MKLAKPIAKELNSKSYQVICDCTLAKPNHIVNVSEKYFSRSSDITAKESLELIKWRLYCEKLTSKDLLSLEDYDSNRETIKSEVIESKHRLITIGSNIVLLFENYETIRYQVQEMLRIEKIFKK